MPRDHFTPAERAVFRRLSSPEKIQRYLDDLQYDKEPRGPRCRSPRMVMRDRTAHCMSGALMGAAALHMLGHAPLLLDLEAVLDLRAGGGDVALVGTLLWVIGGAVALIGALL